MLTPEILQIRAGEPSEPLAICNTLGLPGLPALAQTCACLQLMSWTRPPPLGTEDFFLITETAYSFLFLLKLKLKVHALITCEDGTLVLPYGT